MAETTIDPAALVAELAALPVDAADAAAVRDALVSLGRLRSWLDSVEVRLARRLEAVSSFPEKVLGEAARSSVASGDRILRRAEVLTHAPSFDSALAAGTVTSGHVDALGRVLRRLDPGPRARLLADTDRLLGDAARSSVEDFARCLQRKAARLADDNGEGRLARQRVERRCRTWVDADSGMWCLHARYDPETGVRLQHHLDAALSTLFHDRIAEGCPDDPGEKQDHLRALALEALVGGGPVDRARDLGAGRPQPVVVVDTTSPAGPSIDWGIPVELPRRVLHDLFAVTDPAVAVVRNGIVLHAPGQLRLGRSTRLANRAQRRALHALYATCAIPGCAVHVRHTKPHHVIWWERGGFTDLENLLPLCERHHHCVHDRGWTLALGPNRELTVTSPDGDTMTTGPPRRHAA